MFQTISLIAVAILVVHAVWCLLCKRVSDGVLGKLLYLFLCLAALAYLSRPNSQSQALLNVTYAAIAIRHWWLKTYWSKVKGRIMRRVHFYQSRVWRYGDGGPPSRHWLRCEERAGYRYRVYGFAEFRSTRFGDGHRACSDTDREHYWV